MSTWYDHGYSTAQRGFGPHSPRVLAVYSREWEDWHRGHAQFGKDEALRQRRETFFYRAQRYQQAADAALAS